jgi:hypothetical protein
VVSEATDFRCDDCGAEPQAPCVYMPPPGRPYAITFWAKPEYRRSSGFSYIEVPFRRYEAYEETVRTYLRSYRHEMEQPEEADEQLTLPRKWRDVGKPLTGKVAYHSARARALWDYLGWADEQAMRQYLGEWLQDNASLFAEVK